MNNVLYYIFKMHYTVLSLCACMCVCVCVCVCVYLFVFEYILMPVAYSIVIQVHWDLQSWQLNRWCSHNKICTAVGPLSKAPHPTCYLMNVCVRVCAWKLSSMKMQIGRGSDIPPVLSGIGLQLSFHLKLKSVPQLNVSSLPGAERPAKRPVHAGTHVCAYGSRSKSGCMQPLTQQALVKIDGSGKSGCELCCN